MFKKLHEFILKVKELFSRNDINQIIGKEPAINEVMSEEIELWLNCYRGQAPWVDDYIKSLNLEASICREFADVVLSEMQIEVSNKRLNEIVKKHISTLTENLQSGLCCGSFVLKPLGEDKAEFVTADKFIPLSFTADGRVDDIVFVSKKVISKDSVYYRFERHWIDRKGLNIQNKAYHSQSESYIGQPCSLEEVYEWSGLPEEITFPTDRIDFGYYRNPIKNEIDGSFNGVSIFANAIELIKKADVQFGRLEWEFESGERAVHVDITALQPVPVKNAKGKMTYKTPQLNKRLYKGINLQKGDGDLYQEFSPEFREASIINGLEQIKRQIEFIVGLAYGDLSDVNSVEKTAEEIKTSKQRKYNRVNAIERNLQTCLEDFIYGLSFYNGLTKSGYSVTCNFSDSVLTNEENERKQDKEDVAIGAMQLWEYRVKWYGESEEQAKAALANSEPDVIE